MTRYGKKIIAVKTNIDIDPCKRCCFNDMCDSVSDEVMDYTIKEWDLPDCKGGCSLIYIAVVVP